MALFQSVSNYVNVDMVISLVTIFLLIRLQSFLRLSTYLIHGIKVFIPKKYSDFVKGAATSHESVSIEQALATLDLSMIEINRSTEINALLRIQGFYDQFETMVQFIFAAICTHVLTSVLHCMHPLQEYSLWLMYLVVTIFYLSIRAMLQMVYFTGMKTKEVKLSIGIFIITLVVLRALLSYRFHLLPSQTMSDVAVHLNALLVQMSIEFQPLPLSLMIMYVELIFLVFLGVGALCMVLPALRLTMTLVKMTLGKPTEAAKGIWRTLLWVDFFAPVVLMIVYSPIFMKFILKDELKENVTCDQSGSEQTCVSRTSYANEQKLILIQSIAMVVFLSLKAITLRKHVQSFMDDSVQTVSMMIIAKDVQQKKILHRVVEVRISQLFRNYEVVLM